MRKLSPLNEGFETMAVSIFNSVYRQSIKTKFSFTMPALVLLFVFFFVPVTSLILISFTEPQLGLQNYQELLATTTYVKVFYNTLLVAGIVTFLSVIIGFPVAWVLSIMPERRANILLAIIILSMWTNLLTRTYAWMVLLQRTGVINKTLLSWGIIDEPLAMVNNLTGVIIGMTYIMLPFLILPLYGVMKKIDPTILSAASLCGATKTQALFRILVPLALPGIMSGALMIFVMSLGYFVTPALLGGASNMMAAELISQLIQSLVNWGLGGAVSLMMVIITFVLYALQIKLFSDR